MTPGEEAAMAWLFDIVAAADVLVDRLGVSHPDMAVQVAIQNYVIIRNRHALPGSGHKAPLHGVPRGAI